MRGWKMKKYEKIIDSISEDMKKGRLKKGDKIPSVRKLSQTFDCNKDTVLKALAEMSRRELIYSIPRSGYYVFTDISEESKSEDFKTTLPELSQISFSDFSLCLNKVLSARDTYLFSTKPDERGLQDLIQSIGNLLPTYDVYTKENQLFISSGAQQALYILSKMDFHNGKNIILIEQPTYHRMNKLVKKLNLPYLTIKRGLNGIDLAELERLFASGNIKFYYTISRLHYPLGISYSENEKKHIVELAKKYDVYVVEDDYMADFETGLSLPLHYYDIAEKIIYIKSFTSIVFSSLRLAILVLPNELIDEFLMYKQLMDYDTNFLIQKAMSLYIDNGMYFKHRDSLLRLYNQKNIELKKALDRACLREYSVFDTKTIFRMKEIYKN